MSMLKKTFIHERKWARVKQKEKVRGDPFRLCHLRSTDSNENTFGWGGERGGRERKSQGFYVGLRLSGLGTN